MQRLFFAGVCVIGLIAIFVAAIFEYQRLRSGDSLLSRRQSRWRLISAAIWMLILGSMAYATIFLWRDSSAPIMERMRFLRVILGASMLMFPALLLLALDVRFTMLAQKLSRLKFEAGLEEVARLEIAKMQNSKREGTNGVENSEEN